MTEEAKDEIEIVRKDGSVGTIQVDIPPIKKESPVVSQALVPASESKPVKTDRKNGRKKKVDPRKDYSEKINDILGREGNKRLDFSKMKIDQLAELYESVAIPTNAIETVKQIIIHSVPGQALDLLKDAKDTINTLNTVRKFLTAGDPESQQSRFPVAHMAKKKVTGVLFDLLNRKDPEDKKDDKK